MTGDVEVIMTLTGTSLQDVVRLLAGGAGPTTAKPSRAPTPRAGAWATW